MLCCLGPVHPTTKTNGLVSGPCVLSDIRSGFLGRFILSEYILPRNARLALDIQLSASEVLEPVQVVLYIGAKRKCLGNLRPGNLTIALTKIIDTTGELLRLVIFDQATETTEEAALVFKDLQWTIVQRPLTLYEKIIDVI